MSAHELRRCCVAVLAIGISFPLDADGIRGVGGKPVFRTEFDRHHIVALAWEY